jgi:acyl-CoA thioesterase I
MLNTALMKILLVLLLFASALCMAQPITKIACVGNSITEGAGIEPGFSYPDFLQQLFGGKAVVVNYGIGGRTLLMKGDLPYRNEEKYRQALASKPNVVIIKLGTNDSKPYNWKYNADFEKDYRDLIRAFKKANKKSRIYLCSPIPVFFNNFDIQQQVVKDEITPRVKSIARKTKVHYIDLHTLYAEYASVVPDGVHPNKEGARILANIIFKHIQ